MRLAYDLAQSRDLEHKIKVKRIAAAWTEVPAPLRRQTRPDSWPAPFW